MNKIIFQPTVKQSYIDEIVSEKLTADLFPSSRKLRGIGGFLPFPKA